MPNHFYKYICIRYVGFYLVVFYGILTIVGNFCRIINIYIYTHTHTHTHTHTYIYIYIGFSLIGFYGISIIAGYLMPHPFYTYILDI